MVDIVSPETRSRMMAGIRGKGTKPELLVRRLLFAEGYRYRLHRSDLPGAPDIVLPGIKLAIFVNGCFWHRHAGCRFAKLPANNADFWQKKLDGNAQRDREAVKALCAAGWRVLTIWECVTRDKSMAPTIGLLVRRWVDGGAPSGEISTSDSVSC